jgi:hypothetical protein
MESTQYINAAQLVEQDMDVTEHEKLSNITLKTQIKVMELCFYYFLHFSHKCIIYCNVSNLLLLLMCYISQSQVYYIL